MHFLIHQNGDLTEMSGFAFTSEGHALRDASKRIGLPCRMASAVVRLDNGPDFPCKVVIPVGSQFGDPHCQEGHMTLIAPSDVATDVAMQLCRRNRMYGQGKVILTPDH